MYNPNLPPGEQPENSNNVIGDDFAAAFKDDTPPFAGQDPFAINPGNGTAEFYGDLTKEGLGEIPGLDQVSSEQMVPGQGRQESLSSSESASVESESNNEQGIKHNDAARITEYVNTGNGNDPDGVMRVIERVDPNGDNPYKELQERLGNDTAEEKKDMYEDLKATQDDRAELVPEAKEKTDEDLRHTLEEAQNAIIEAKGADPKYSRLNEEAIDVGEGLFNHIAEKGGGPNLPNVFYGLKQEEKTSEEKQAETPPPNVVEFQREVYNQAEREEEQGLAA